MKNALILFVLVSHVSVAQDSLRITKNFQNVQLDKVLRTLRVEYNLKIAYDHQLVQGITINQKFESTSLDEVFQRILSPTRLKHQFIGGKIIIIPNETAEVKQPISVSGVVKDGETGETLPNASIHVAGTGKGVITNTDGHFTILEIPSDTSTLVIRYLGYLNRRIQIREINDRVPFVVEMKSDQKVLDEVTIVDDSDSPLQIKEKIGEIAFNPKALSTLPTLGSQDLFRTLQLTPGISSTNESSSGLVIRGAIPSQNLILLDGFTVYHLDHFFGVFGGINADYIKDVQVFKGGFEAKYGGRVSGVVDITGKTGSSSKSNFSIGANMISVNGTADVALSKKFSFLFSFRRAYTDVIQTSLYRKLFTTARETDENANRPVEIPMMKPTEPKFYFYDVNSKITFRPTSKDNISLSLYGGKDDLSQRNDTSFVVTQLPATFEESLHEHAEWGNGGLSLRWGRQWNEKFYSNLKLSGSRYFRNYNFRYLYQLESPDTLAEANFSFRQSNEVNDSNFALDNEWIVSDKVRMDFGFSGMEYQISNVTNANGEAADSAVNVSNIGSFYTTVNVQFSSKFAVAFGMRSNHHQINEEWYHEPRLSATLKLTDKLLLKSSIGRYYQFVNQIQYDDPYNGIQNFWALSVRDGAPVVQSNHYIFGATYKKGDFVFDVEAYYKDLFGVVEFNLAPYLVQEGNLNTDLFLLGTGRMRGIDLLIQKETGKHKGWISYSYSRSLTSYPSIAKGIYYPSMNDQPHEVKLVNMITLGRWNLSSTWVYGSGRPVPKYEVVYVTDSDNIVNDLAVIKDRTNFQRLPDYHRLDLSGAYHFSFGKFTSEVGLAVFNVYGRENIRSRRLSVPSLQRTIGGTSQPLPQYRDLVLIGFTPSLFVNLRF